MQTLICTVCGVSICYKQILSIGMHSAEALLAHRGGGNGWHSRHQHKQSAGLSTDQGRSAHADVIQEYRDKLVFLAKTYPSCRPLNSTSTVLGWYDQGSLPQSQQVRLHKHFSTVSVALYLIRLTYFVQGGGA